MVDWKAEGRAVLMVVLMADKLVKRRVGQLAVVKVGRLADHSAALTVMMMAAH